MTYLRKHIQLTSDTYCQLKADWQLRCALAQRFDSFAYAGFHNVTAYRRHRHVRAANSIGTMVVRPASKASRSSNTAGYRTVGKQSEVDESLFGNNKPGGKPGASSQVETLHTSPSRAPAQAAPETVTLTRGELHRMMGASPIVTLPQAAALKKAAQAKLDEERRVSNARKTRMLALEEERKKIQPATESEMLKQAADAKTLTHAEKLLREQQDEAKAMNQMMLYSKCVTIRDAQLQEKKHMMLEEEEEQRRLDLMMEIERIKALENFEERERQRKVERMKGAKVLQVRSPLFALPSSQTGMKRVTGSAIFASV